MLFRSETKEELFRFLDPRMLRRTKAQVLPQLPPKTYSTRLVEMSAKQRKAYEQIRKEMMAQLEGGTLIAANPLTKLTRMLQFASCYGEINEADQLLLTLPSCKVDALLEIVEEVGDETAVIFAESKQLIDLATAALMKEKYRVGTITGAVDAQTRAERVGQFNERRLQFLTVTLGAGGEGLSFPGCTTAVFLQRSFNFILNAQAEDRIHGLGRGSETAASQIIDIITRDSLEARVHAVYRENAENLEAIVRDEETLKA